MITINKPYILVLSNAIVALVEFLLSLRILLKLLGARTTAPFVTWVYETTKPLLSPFEGMFPTSNLGNGFVLEASALFALLVYAFLGFLLESAVTQLTHPAGSPIEEVTVTKTRKR